MHEPRRTEIVDLVNQKGELSFSELKAYFSDMSEMTLRSDLKALDREGRIIRFHGGARTINTIGNIDDNFFCKSIRNITQKQIIAQKALRLLHPEDSIFIDCGSTMVQLALLLPDEPGMIVTNNISCDNQLSHLMKPEIFMMGGRLNRLNMSVSSPMNTEMMSHFHFDIAFMAATSFDTQSGFTSLLSTYDEIRRMIIAQSTRVVVLMDSSKIGSPLPVVSFPLESVDAVVSDGGLPGEIVRFFESRDIEVY